MQITNPQLLARIDKLSERMDEADRAYFAGLIDGEGCIHIARQKDRDAKRTYGYRLQVIVGWTHSESINGFCSDLGIGSVHHQPRNNAKWADCYAWRMNALDGGALLYLCRPYIRLKREQVEVALRFQDRKFQYLRFGKSDEHHRQEQEDYKRMRELKGTASRGRRRQTA